MNDIFSQNEVILNPFGNNKIPKIKKDDEEEKETKPNLEKIYGGHCSNHCFIPANKIPKSDILYKYSNPKKVQQNANRFFNKNLIVYKSDKPTKKYFIMDNNKKIYFGTMNPPMEDFTKHQDEQRRINYLNRATNIKGNWKDKISPNLLAILLLWQ